MQVPHSVSWLILCIDYLIREVVSLTKGGVEPRILSTFKAAVQASRMKMAHVISVLCFVSRMRLRDRDATTAIPFCRRMYDVLYKFFDGAAFHGPVGVHYQLLPIPVCVDSRTQSAKRQGDMLVYQEEVERLDDDSRAGVKDDVIEQKIIEGIPDLCTHVRARVERLCAFFELPPDLSLPPQPIVRSIWEMPSLAVSPSCPQSTAPYYQRAPGFR